MNIVAFEGAEGKRREGEYMDGVIRSPLQIDASLLVMKRNSYVERFCKSFEIKFALIN